MDDGMLLFIHFVAIGSLLNKEAGHRQIAIDDGQV